MFTKSNILLRIDAFLQQKACMSLNEELRFSEIVQQVADSLRAGGVLFDRQLRVLEMTSLAEKLLCSAESIDQVLAMGTGGSLCERWTDLIGASLLANQKAVFDKLPYWGPEGRHLLDVVCVPICSADRQVIGGILIVRDVAESVDTANEIAQSDRVAAVARVASKVAHELNNPTGRHPALYQPESSHPGTGSA
jgi:hypothetical protein